MQLQKVLYHKLNAIFKNNIFQFFQAIALDSIPLYLLTAWSEFMTIQIASATERFIRPGCAPEINWNSQIKDEDSL